MRIDPNRRQRKRNDEPKYATDDARKRIDNPIREKSPSAQIQLKMMIAANDYDY
jgi:hypothetical protein